MKETREITPRKIEPVEIERPFETAMPATVGSYGGYRDLGSADGGFQLITYWRIIRKRIWLVLGIAVLLTTLVAVYMARKPNIYQARSVVQVDLEESNPDLVTSSNPRASTNNQDPAYFNTQLQLLTSESLLRRVIKELSLDSNKEFQKLKTDSSVSALSAMLKAVGLASDVPKKTGGVDEVSVSANPSLASSEEIAEAVRLAPYVDIIKKNMSVEPVRESRSSFKDTRLIELTYRHTDPEFAAFVVNGISEVFAKANQEKRSGTSGKTNEFLENRVAQLQSEIKQGEQQLVTLTSRAGILNSGENQTIVLSGLDILNKQLLDAENDRKNAQAEYESVSNSPEGLNARSEDLAGRYTTERENSIRDLRNDTAKKIADLNAARNRLLEEYQPTAQEVKEVDTQIKALNDGLKTAVAANQSELDAFRKRVSGDLLNNLRTKYQSAKAREDKIRASFDAQYNQAQGQNQSGVSLSLLKQDIETKKGFLKGLLDNQRNNDVVAAGTKNNIAVAEIAIPNNVPIAPRRLTTVLGALFLSTLFGMGLALFLEYLDDTIRTTEEIESLLGLPALAAIPRIDAAPKRKLLLVGAGEEGENIANPTANLLIHKDSRSSLAEAYRQLRTSILLSTAGHAPKSLLVTSSLPSEGKTTTAINTAISLAQTGAKVLIIDADMRRPRLHSIFEISNAQGLSTLLASELDDQQIDDAVQFDEEARLNLLPSGPVPPNPAELIGSEQMANLLQKCQGKFTHVVIDSPPIASFTDGVLIASMVDGVILVVSSGRSSRQVVRRSRQLLVDIGAKIFGVVLNNVDLRSQDNSYYYQSYYHRDNYRSDDE